MIEPIPVWVFWAIMAYFVVSLIVVYQISKSGDKRMKKIDIQCPHCKMHISVVIDTEKDINSKDPAKEKPVSDPNLLSRIREGL